MPEDDQPVDYDNRFDPDCPTEPGGVITNIMSFIGEPNLVFVKTMDGQEFDGNEIHSCINLFSTNINEQIEARLEELGWELKRKRPWKDECATNKG